MIVNAGQVINISMTVVDNNGIEIFDDTPKVIIKSLNKNKYFNGLLFSDDPVEIMMPHMGSGIYGFDFMLDSVDELSIEMTSERYNINKSLHVIVIPEDCVHYAKPNEEFVYYTPIGEKVNILAYILTNSNGQYYCLDTSSWTDMKTYNTLFAVNDKMAKMSITLEEGEYSVLIIEDGNPKYTFTLKVTNEKAKGEVVIVNSSTLRGLDGTDTVVLSESESPLAGVKVTAISVETKQPVGMTTTNEVGEWHMMIERGNYLFTFERQGYTPVSFIKEV